MIDKRFHKYAILLIMWIAIDIFWPGFDTRNAEYIAWQFSCVSLFCISFLFDQVRKSKNVAPAIFTTYAMISVFTHGIHPVYLEGLTQCIMFTLAFYSIVNFTDEDHVLDIKKAIVLIAAVNILFAYGQVMGYRAFFDTDQAIGFIGQKWNFGILCAIAFPLALEWNIFLAIFMLVGVVMADKYAIYLPVLCLFFVNRKLKETSPKITIPVLVVAAAVALFYKTHMFHFVGTFHTTHEGIRNFVKGEIDLKVMPRLHHWGVMLHYCFARIIDGWGLNSYPNHVWSREKPGSIEMHNEPLNMLFEGGLVAMAIVFGWFNYIRKRVYIWKLDGITSSLFVISLASLFHSVLHAPNILLLFVVMLAVWEIEHGDYQFVNGKSYPTGGFVQSNGSRPVTRIFARFIPKNKRNASVLQES